MARCLQLLFVALFVFASLQRGESLKCYDCIGKPGEECDNPSKNSNFIKECPNEAGVACYFRNTTLLAGAGQIVRNCGRITDCPENRATDVNSTCLVCEKNLCNSSSYAMPSMFIVSIVSVIFAKIYL